MNNWVYIIIFSLLLLGYLLWNEFQRPNKARWLWRVLATVLSVGALAGMILPVYYSSTKQAGKAQEAIVLTEGFDADSVAYFLKKSNKDYTVFCFDETLVTAKRFHPAIITTPDSLHAKKYAAIHLFGYGPGKQVLDHLEQEQLVFHPTTLTAGITAVHWQRVAKAGDKWYVQGTATNTGGSTLIIRLSGLGLTQDSVIIPACKQQPFQLTAIPKQLGRMVYLVSVTSGKDTVEKNQLPLIVQQSDPLKILMLASSPDFENKFLKNHLAEKGYAVTIRTNTSKAKFESDYANMQAFNSSQINATVLNKFDVLIADAEALSNLGNEERSSIQTAVRQKGMGLVVRADTAAQHNSFYNEAFPMSSGLPAIKQQIQLQLPDTTIHLQPLMMEAPAIIQSRPGTQALIKDKENRVYVSSKLYGAGKIVFSSLANTYSWTLSGQQYSYDAVWANIINKALSPQTSEESWFISPALPETNHPARLLLQTNAAGASQATVTGATVQMNKSEDLNFELYGSFWPLRQGWQTGVQLNGKIYYWYAYANSDWKNVRAAGLLKTQKEYLQQKQTGVNSGIQQATIAMQQRIPAIYFFLLFLLACGYLWVENKYTSG